MVASNTLRSNGFSRKPLAPADRQRRRWSSADIINTVAVDPTFRSVGVLGMIVLVRTFLSFTLELEITGRWPWQAKPEPAVPAAATDSGGQPEARDQRF